MAETVKRALAVVSFNLNEARAVDMLLDDLVTGVPSPWDGERAIRRPYGAEEWHIEHVPLAAQGNVLAGAQLAEFFTDHDPPDYVVFYGCAGALNRADANSVFLVQHANYLSLGTVERSAGPLEKVTLKNKWLCHVTPQEVDPLESVLEGFR